MLGDAVADLEGLENSVLGGLKRALLPSSGARERSLKEPSMGPDIEYCTREARGFGERMLGGMDVKAVKTWASKWESSCTEVEKYIDGGS